MSENLPDKAQALHRFWSSFGLPAYDENSVPDDENRELDFDENSVPTRSAKPSFPYITYSVATDCIGYDVGLSASLWYRSSSWADISRKADEIAKKMDEMPSAIPISGGYLWLKRGNPFAQRMSDPADDMIRRIYINVTAEYLTAY